MVFEPGEKTVKKEYVIQFYNDLGWCDYKINDPQGMDVAPNLVGTKKIVNQLRTNYDEYKFQIILRTVTDKRIIY